MYIINLQNDLQDDGTKLNEEKILITVQKCMKNLVVKMITLKKMKRERMRRTQRNQPTLTSVAMRNESEPNNTKLKNPRMIMKSQEIKIK